jgi:hypothetical protein
MPDCRLFIKKQLGTISFCQKVHKHQGTNAAAPFDYGDDDERGHVDFKKLKTGSFAAGYIGRKQDGFLQ